MERIGRKAGEKDKNDASEDEDGDKGWRNPRVMVQSVT